MITFCFQPTLIFYGEKQALETTVLSGCVCVRARSCVLSAFGLVQAYWLLWTFVFTVCSVSTTLTSQPATTDNNMADEVVLRDRYFKIDSWL